MKYELITTAEIYCGHHGMDLKCSVSPIELLIFLDMVNERTNGIVIWGVLFIGKRLQIRQK